MSSAVVILAALMREQLSIAPGAIQIWWARLSDLAADEAWYETTLSPDELERAMRFRFAADRRRFTLARGALRALLGRYLGVEPRALSFIYGAQGKPALAGQPGGPDLHFNLSHARGLAIYAVASGRRVGVDIEALDLALDFTAIARHFFAPGEIRALDATPPQLRPGLFFTYWTRKEALIKAHGGGMMLDLGQIDVSAPAALEVAASRPPAATATIPGSEPYALVDLHAEPGYAACCALAGREPPRHLQEGMILPARGCNRTDIATL